MAAERIEVDEGYLPQICPVEFKTVRSKFVDVAAKEMRSVQIWERVRTDPPRRIAFPPQPVSCGQGAQWLRCSFGLDPETDRQTARLSLEV